MERLADALATTFATSQADTHVCAALRRLLPSLEFTL